LGYASFRPKDWERFREKIVMSYPSEAFREANHIKNKWKKLRKQYYKEKKLHNVSRDNAGSSWVWYDAMDAMLSETAKANGVPGAID
jgi:hypothetical protein